MRFFLIILVIFHLANCSGRNLYQDGGIHPNDEYDASDEQDGQDVDWDTTGSDDQGLVDDDQQDDKPWHVGGPQTLEIGTWNIRNFPENQDTVQRTARLINEMDVDLLGVQEIANMDAFDALLGMLPAHAAVISDHEYSSGEYQKTAFIYRRALIQVRQVLSLFTDDGYAFPRPPFQAALSIAGKDGSRLNLIAINVHLKAEPGEENLIRRRAACGKLKSYIDSLEAQEIENEIVILGDFNDQLNDPIEENAFTGFIDSPLQYRFVSQKLIGTQQGFSYIRLQSLIDHILITDDLYSVFQQANIQALALEQWIDEYNYQVSISDHRPVVVVIPWP